MTSSMHSSSHGCLTIFSERGLPEATMESRSPVTVSASHANKSATSRQHSR